MFLITNSIYLDCLARIDFPGRRRIAYCHHAPRRCEHSLMQDLLHKHSVINFNDDYPLIINNLHTRFRTLFSIKNRSYSTNYAVSDMISAIWIVVRLIASIPGNSRSFFPPEIALEVSPLLFLKHQVLTFRLDQLNVYFTITTLNRIRFDYNFLIAAYVVWTKIPSFLPDHG